MTFYSELLENILCDVIPAKMGKIGWVKDLDNDMIAKIIKKSFDFREKEQKGMHATIKAIMKACEFIQHDNDSIEFTYSCDIHKTWEEYSGYITGYLSDYGLFSNMRYTLEDYLLYPVPVQEEMINIVYKAIAQEINDFLWKKFFK